MSDAGRGISSSGEDAGEGTKAPGHRVLGIVGSPRAKGNSAGLLDLALEGAEQRGCHVERIWLRHLKIMPCNACDGCKRGPACIVRDDMDRLYGALDRADMLVLATPTYFYSMSGWVKAFVDRTYGLLDPQFHPRLAPGKKLYVIVTQESEEHADGEALVRVIERGFGWLGMEFAGALVASGLAEAGAYLEHPAYLEGARHLVR